MQKTDRPKAILCDRRRRNSENEEFMREAVVQLGVAFPMRINHTGKGL